MSIDQGTSFISCEDKSLTLTTTYRFNANIDDYQIKRNKQLIKVMNTNPSGRGMNGVVYSSEGMSPTLTTNKGEGIKLCIQSGMADDIKGFESNRRIYSQEGKAPSLLSSPGGHKMPKIAEPGEDTYIMNETYRRMTPVECERLQTVPDNYTSGVSDSQRYKMLGNGWTVDVIAHLFKGLNCDETLL